MYEELNKARLKALRKLNRRKSRDEERRFLVEGVRILEDAIRAGIEVDFAVVQRGERPRGNEVEKRFGALLDSLGNRVHTLDARNFEELTDTKSPQGILACCKMPPVVERDDGSEPLLVLDTIRDPGNLGTCLRSAAAFGIRRVSLIKGSADPWSPKTVRASMGGLFALDGLWLEPEEAALERALRRQTCLALDAAPDLPDFFGALPKGDRSISIVIGGETTGLSQVWHEPEIERVSISQDPAVDSLNAAMAATLTTNALWRSLQAVNS